ncbi:hypothetical protein NXY11_04005 [Parabacteroides faecis]|uniref:hypothetical protein n=1 Tax=Parabacteroides faecis TaxID=1217282 RepID=UPI002164A82A|nr:hypothetical protein [Parabacteroides faecis]MCS2893990.1 hypothetical protein [Parabacteroides faecis]UVQ47420.1 hypothetical protein NXY11_04005 [Parabacteroides faecis]
MKDALNNGLIKAMREHLPEETNLANYIMDIISIGKEAVYRRLRGEVPFTFLKYHYYPKVWGSHSIRSWEPTGRKGPFSI